MKLTVFRMYYLVLVALLLLGLPVSADAQQRTIVTLDNAISGAAEYLKQQDAIKGKNVVFTGFKADTEGLAHYIMSRLRVHTQGYFTIVVERGDSRNLALLQQEIEFTDTGAVKMESEQIFGEMEGAEFTITGSIEKQGNAYTLGILVLRTQAGVHVAEYQTYVSKNDKKIKSFLPKSTGEKIGTGTMNILFGLGSYLERDISGGITLTAGYAVAAGLMVIEAVALDWDSPAVGVPATIGVAVAGATLVYGFARPFIYDRSPQTANILDNAQPEIIMESDRSGNNALSLRLAYSIKY
jgi:hypothetical protein